MAQTQAAETATRLAHDYRTPVNHVVGYSRLLIREARASRIESLVPGFEQIHADARTMAELIRNRGANPADESPEEANQAETHDQLREISRRTAFAVEDIQRNLQQALADLDGLAGAVQYLLDLQDDEDGIGWRCYAEETPDSQTGAGRERLTGRILVVDDDPINRSLLRRHLEANGHEIEEAQNGLEALDVLRRTRCDVVLLDIMMPVMDGFRTLAALKHDAVWREMPVIMISGFDEVQSVARCIALGAEDYLSKPFNRVLLKARIQACLERQHERVMEGLKIAEQDTAGLA